MVNQPLFDMTDLEVAKRRFDQFGQVSTQISKAEYDKLYEAAKINEKMLRLGKRRDLFGRIWFYLNIIPAGLRTEFLIFGKKQLDGALAFYQIY